MLQKVGEMLQKVGGEMLQKVGDLLLVFFISNDTIYYKKINGELQCQKS